MSRRSQALVATLACALLLAACDSEPDVEPIEPTETAAEPEPEAEPDPEPEDDDVPEIFQGQLYPPLPDLEPDPNAGDLEPQEEVLALHSEVWDLLETATATGELDRQRFDEVVGEPVATEYLERFEQDREDGVVGLAPDGEVAWVDVIVSDGDEVVLGKCISVGPLTGEYELESGQPTFDEDPDFGAELVRTYTYGRVNGTWLLVGVSSGPQEGCSALQ